MTATRIETHERVILRVFEEFDYDDLYEFLSQLWIYQGNTMKIIRKSSS